MSDLESQLAQLGERSRTQLKERWRSLYGAAPPIAFTPDLLARGIAYRLQEKVLGPMSKALEKQLSSSEQSRPKGSALRIGNRLVRRWQGATYVVEVLEEGFSYNGAKYRSLSEIATLITGTRWSGPRFFGLKK